MLICRQVIATEVSKASVQVAQHNLKQNKIRNASIFRVSSEEFTAAWKIQVKLHRLESVDFNLLKLETILVDPPRAGLDDETVQLLKEFKQIVYISCNPETLHQNLLKVADTHTIRKFALFDQFPYTAHIECGVYMERKAEAAPPELPEQHQTSQAGASEQQQHAELASLQSAEQQQVTEAASPEQQQVTEAASPEQQQAETFNVAEQQQAETFNVAEQQQVGESSSGLCQKPSQNAAMSDLQAASTEAQTSNKRKREADA